MSDFHSEDVSSILSTRTVFIPGEITDNGLDMMIVLGVVIERGEPAYEYIYVLYDDRVKWEREDEQ